MAILKFSKILVARVCQFISLGLFFLLFPLVIISCFLRFSIKKIFGLKPNIILSPIGGPVPYFNKLAIETQGYKVAVISFDWPKYFHAIKTGFILADYRFWRLFGYLTNYIFFFTSALLKYDIFEFPFSGGILRHSYLRKIEYNLLKLCSKKISVFGYGSDCKILSLVRRGHKYSNAMDRSDLTESSPEKIVRANVERAQKYADILISGGDAIHLGPKALILPLATDLELWPYQRLSKNRLVTILHSTNHRSHKGTRFILAVIDKLKTKLPLKLLLLEGKSFEECQKIYPKADFFITDVITGWHGFTAIEAMAIGRPVITYLRPDIMKFHAYYAQGRIPAISANPDTLAEAIIKLVKNPKLREELGRRGREYALKFHSLEFVGALRAIIYEFIWSGKKINQKIFEKEVKKRKLT